MGLLVSFRGPLALQFGLMKSFQTVSVRLSEKGAQRCRVTNSRQPAGQEQALSSHFVGSRGTVLVSIETFQTVSQRLSN